MEDSHTKKLVRQFNAAIESINHLRNNYRPENSDYIGKIAENIVKIYEIFESGNIDKLGYDRGENAPIPRLKSYFIEENMFAEDVCLVLMNNTDSKIHYGYTRLKVVKFLRGEAGHAKDVDERNNSLKALKRFLYEENPEENPHFKPVFAIRKDSLQFPNVIRPNEKDSDSPFDEPLRLVDGQERSLTTIESVVFSICNEIGHMSQTGAMGWDKGYVDFDVSRFKEILRCDIADNIIGQSEKWKKWNK